MNETYPYPIDNAIHIPASVDDANRAYNLLREFKYDLPETDTDTFLNGWFAMHFLGLAPHPDDLDDWPSDLRPHADEAWRRQKAQQISEDQLYCSDSQQQGIRLQMDGNLRSYVIGTLGDQIGYVSAVNDPDP